MQDTSPKLCLVAAMAKNRVIGKGLDIPWKIKGEQLRFKALTTGKVMVLGRLTYESIGRPLPNRTNVVLTRDKDYQAEGCEVFTALEDVLTAYADEPEIMIAGGGHIYSETLPRAHKIYLTVIDKIIEGDILFPEFDRNQFDLLETESVEAELPYTCYTYQRKANNLE